MAKTSGATTSKRGDRIYIPFEGSKTQVTNSSPVQKEIETTLSGTDFKLKDYVKGVVLDKLGRDQKIGKVLTKLGKPELVNKFNADKTREGAKKSELMLVFSKHPYDIAGMSTDRGWSSCMELYTGAYKRYVKWDIKEGSFIIYLAKSDDLNLKSPRARCVAKPYINIESKQDVVYSTGSKIYGTAPGDFITTVQELIDTIQPNKVGVFELDSKLYCDAQLTTIYKFTPEMQSIIDGKTKATTKDQVKTILDNLEIKNYTINEDLTVDVTGNIKIDYRPLKVIPVQFGVVTGDFICSINQLTTLKGAPTKVGGYFNCTSNQLTTLKGGPTKVGEDFYCGNNQLTTLQGGPIKVGKNFYCNGNKLTTLEGGPTEVGGDFDFQNNSLSKEAIEWAKSNIAVGGNRYGEQ